MIYGQISIRSTPIYIVKTFPFIFIAKFEIRFVFYIASLRYISSIIREFPKFKH